MGQDEAVMGISRDTRILKYYIFLYAFSSSGNEMLNIKRKRYVIIRDDSDIFCGLARNYQFKKIGDIGNTSIKTYATKETAQKAFVSNVWYADEMIAQGRIKIVKVLEGIEEI